MEESTKPFIEWLSNNWGWVIAFISIFIEIVPIKLSPISSLFKWIGKKINAGVNCRIDNLDKKIDEIDERLEDQETLIDMQRIAGIRSLILSFADELRRGNPASHEQFIHVMNENGEYEKLVSKHKIINSVYAESYKYICNKYHDCMDKNSFLA